MNEPRSFDPRIADAIIQARLLRIEPLKEVAATAINLKLSDGEWEAIRPRWEWHDAMSSDELQRRCGVKP